MINSPGGVSTKVVSACNMDRNIVESAGRKSGWRSWQWGWCQGSSLTVGGARAAGDLRWGKRRGRIEGVCMECKQSVTWRGLHS